MSPWLLGHNKGDQLLLVERPVHISNVKALTSINQTLLKIQMEFHKFYVQLRQRVMKLLYNVEVFYFSLEHQCLYDLACHVINQCISPLLGGKKHKKLESTEDSFVVVSFCFQIPSEP